MQKKKKTKAEKINDDEENRRATTGLSGCQELLQGLVTWPSCCYAM